MKQSSKGKQWHFGMKLHIGVDEQTALVDSLASTAANVHDLSLSDQLLHGEEVRVRDDAGYGGIEKRQAHQNRQVAWHIAIRAGQRRKLARDQQKRLMEECKSSVRAKVEHVFFTLSRCLTRARAATEVWRRRRIVWPYCQDSPIRYPHSLVGCEFYGIGVADEAESGKNPTIGQG